MVREMLVLMATMCALASAMVPCSPDYCASLRCATSNAENTAREQGYRPNIATCYCRASVDFMDGETSDNVEMPTIGCGRPMYRLFQPCKKRDQKRMDVSS